MASTLAASRFHCRGKGGRPRRVVAARAGSAPPPAAPLPTSFSDLLGAARATGCVDTRPTAFANGLVATRAALEGDVLLRVPREACLLLDYDSGLALREAPWPELQAALAHDDSLPWDLLLALALVDSALGNGDPFWQAYVAGVLPSPQELLMPFCQPPERLAALQHPRIAANAATQQQRLAASFPHLAVPAVGRLPQRRRPTPALQTPGQSHTASDAAHPTLLEWAFACVRSRAFRLSESAFAFVPFLDVANHSATPNANFRTAADGAVELLALQDVPEGGEVTVSYTGPAGATNQRLLVQYGFFPDDNFSDRLDLGLAGDFMTPTPLCGSPGRGVSLALLQQHMGDGLFSQMVSGKAPTLLAALKSIPTYDDDAADLTLAQRAQELEVVADLKARLAAVEGEFTTTLAEDESLLLTRFGSEWDALATRYRLTRKSLAAALRTLLRVYERVLCEEIV